ncbi:MAG: glutamyl-tRNA reductase [Cytophagales bacterium]|nr:glutamyl-tRNA reductase [Armatimonadota bacterium]
MSLSLIGLSHHTAPVEVRERIAFTAPGALKEALVYLKETLRGTGAEAVLLSTCNRTELYLASPTDFSTDDRVSLLLGARGASSHDGSGFPPHLIEKRGGHLVTEHLFRVASGLESMVLGESDIVRQVKSAYGESSAAGLSGTVLNPLFHDALRVAKRARTENDLGRGAFSVGHAAADLAETIFGSLAGRTVLLLGAGKMSETTARHLASAGAASVLVANRTFDRAARLAEILNGRAIHYDAFPEHLLRADIVIASTAAPHAVVHRDMVEGVMRQRRQRPLFLIDIAVPRDIETAVGDIDGVFLYNIDDLQQVVASDIAERRSRAAKAEAMVREEALAFASRLRAQQSAAPLVTEVRAKLHSIAEAELARLRPRLQNVSEDEWRAIVAMVQSIENKIAHDPTVKIKEFAAAVEGGLAPAEDVAQKMETVRELFNLSVVASRDDAGKPIP